MTKSIIGLIVLGLLATPTYAAERPVIENYLALTSIEPRCSAPRAGNEIVVCGRRRADRWRVPFILKDAGDPSIQNVSAERNRLASEPKQKCGNTIFGMQADCGMVGIGTSVGIGGDRAVKLRPLAD
jgi:hypothetical protein